MTAAEVIKIYNSSHWSVVVPLGWHAPTEHAFMSVIAWHNLDIQSGRQNASVGRRQLSIAGRLRPEAEQLILTALDSYRTHIEVAMDIQLRHRMRCCLAGGAAHLELTEKLLLQKVFSAEMIASLPPGILGECLAGNKWSYVILSLHMTSADCF